MDITRDHAREGNEIMSTPSSNSDAALSFLVQDIEANLTKASGAGYDTLRAFAEIGRGLTEAKDILSGTKGAFGEWCDQNFKFSKEWRARLMKLHSAWADFESAKAWAEASGRILGRKEFSVDGALAFINEWKKATTPQSEGGEGGEGEGGGEGSAAGPKAKKKSQAELLREQLAEALERIAKLEAENERLRGAKAGPKEGPKADRKEGPKGVDAATKARAAKVWALWERGGTDGEKEGAKARLTAMAEKLGMSFADFLAACGLKDCGN